MRDEVFGPLGMKSVGFGGTGTATAKWTSPGAILRTASLCPAMAQPWTTRRC